MLATGHGTPRKGHRTKGWDRDRSHLTYSSPKAPLHAPSACDLGPGPTQEPEQGCGVAGDGPTGLQAGRSSRA